MTMNQQGALQEDQGTPTSGFTYMTTILGFGLCRAWIVLCISAVAFVPAYHIGGLYLFAGAAGSLVLALLAPRLQEVGSRSRVHLFRITTASILLAVLLMLLALLLKQPLGLLIAILLGGAGVGSLQVLWGERFAAHPLQFSTIAAPSAAIVTALIVALTSEAASVIALVLFPLTSLALLFMRTDSRFGSELFTLSTSAPSSVSSAPAAPAASAVASTSSTSSTHSADAPEVAADALDTRASRNRQAPAQKQKPHASQSNLMKLMFSIALFSFLCRSYDSFLEAAVDPFAFIGGASLLSLIVVGVVFLLFALAAKDHFNAAFTYRLSLPIMVVGLAAAALFLDRFAAISLLAINIGYEFFDILIWILLAQIARRQNHPFRVYGYGVAFTFVGMASGYTLAPLFHDFLVQNGLSSESFALLGIISLVIVAFLVVPESTLTQLTAPRPTPWDTAFNAENDGDEPSFKGRLEQQCGLVAAEFGLTAREIEVLDLLARGRTLAIIARDLQIAKSTARTHIESIYLKLHVHKQQELIDLVESYPASRTLPH